MLSPIEYHERNHGHRDAPPPPFDECRKCQWGLIRCGGKRSYPDPLDAAAACREVNTKNGWNPPVRTYQCRFCLNWHLTARLNKHQARRAEKHRRKTLRQTA